MEGKGHRDYVSRGHFPVRRHYPQRKAVSLPVNSTHQGDCSHCDVPNTILIKLNIYTWYPNVSYSKQREEKKKISSN